MTTPGVGEDYLRHTLIPELENKIELLDKWNKFHESKIKDLERIISELLQELHEWESGRRRWKAE